ncbi:MAG: hypothetical protein ABI318_09735 [Chthoniobacteraceae bacterium]
MRRFRLFFSHETVAALAAIPVRRRLALFNLMDAITLFPYDGENLHGEGRKQPIYARRFGEWRVVWWVDVPVGEVQVLLIERRLRR